MTKVFRNNLRYENMCKKGRVGVFGSARKRTFRFAEKNASFQKGRTFRFADYKSFCTPVVAALDTI